MRTGKLIAATLTVCLSWPCLVHAQWTYTSRPDALTSRILTTATTRSTNSHRFASPYAGGTKAKLTLQQEADGELDVLLEVNRGQFMCLPGDCFLRLRFDDGLPLLYAGSSPSDGSTNLVFIAAETALLARLRGAKTMRIEATFHREGARVFQFTVDNLRWPHR